MPSPLEAMGPALIPVLKPFPLSPVDVLIWLPQLLFGLVFWGREG